MAVADKKTDQADMDQGLSIVEGQTNLQQDDEPIKKTVPAALQDPFAGEENGQVQYRSMKWWWVICFCDCG